MTYSSRFVFVTPASFRRPQARPASAAPAAADAHPADGETGQGQQPQIDLADGRPLDIGVHDGPPREALLFIRNIMSALPVKADIRRGRRNVRFVHEQTHAPQQKQLYSITLSARASSLAGIVRPSALAALRLMTSSSFVGCSTGRLAGRAPLTILSMSPAAR